MAEPFADYTSPAVATFTDAPVQAFRHPLVAPPPVGFNGGLVIGDSPRHQRLRHSRYWEPVDRFDPHATFADKLDGAFLYFGPVYDHFGHMMAEMVHRLIPALRVWGGGRLLMVDAQAAPPRRYEQLPPFLIEILKLLDIGPDRVTVIRADTIVSELSVCEQGSDFGGGPKAGYLPYLTEGITPRLNRAHPDRTGLSKVYVSRSKHRPGGSFLGESYLEEQLAREGYTIFHPQDHGLIHQMHVYRSADVLIFPEGSACHGVELLGEQSLGSCHLLLRRENHREIFGRVLKARAREFDTFDATIPLGTAVVDRGQGVPLDYLGVSLFRVGELIDYFRTRGLARLPRFDASDYLTRARVDLIRYADAWAGSHEHAFSQTRFAELRESFLSALDDD